MGPIAQKILIALLVRVLESTVTPDSVKAAVQSVLDWAEAEAAKTKTTIDDTVVAAVETLVMAGTTLADVTAAAVRLADQLADKTPSSLDDAVVEAVADALDVELPKEG